MRAGARRLAPGGSADGWIAGGAVGAFGCGAVVGAAGWAAGDLPVMVGGGLLLSLGVAVLIAAGWMDGLPIVALSVPLPALYQDAHLRIAVAAPLTAVVVVSALFRWGVASRPPVTGGLPRGPTLALLAALVLAAAFGAHPLASLREVVNVSVLVGLLVVAVGALNGSPGRVRSLTTLLVAVGAATGALAVLEAVGVIPGEFPRWGTPYNRAALGFGHPNGLGLFLAVTVPLAAHEVARGRGVLGRGIAGLAALAVVFGLFATFSRGAWVAVLFGAAAFFLTGDGRRALGIWLGAAAVLLVVDLASGGLVRDTAMRTLDDWVIEQRAVLVLAGVLMFLDAPLLGVGPGGFAQELERYGARIPELWDYQATPHNAYVQMAAEAGIVGLLAFLVFLGACLRVLVRRVREAREGREAGEGQEEEERGGREEADQPGRAGGEEAGRARAYLWSFATVAIAGAAVWPFAHGAGQGVILVLALGLAASGWGGASPGRPHRSLGP